MSIDHAEFMNSYFNSKGILSSVLTSNSSREERNMVQEKLKHGKINIIFTVDLYNEGVDIPFIDTVLFLRPTESLTIFLQQLGRGLRNNNNKTHLTVLDFIAPQHRHFDYISRFKALSAQPNIRVDNQIKAGMPFVPAGCIIHLERQAKEYVLKNIEASTANMRGHKFLKELKQISNNVKGEISLKFLINALH